MPDFNPGQIVMKLCGAMPRLWKEQLEQKAEVLCGSKQVASLENKLQHAAEFHWTGFEQGAPSRIQEVLTTGLVCQCNSMSCQNLNNGVDDQTFFD